MLKQKALEQVLIKDNAKFLYGDIPRILRLFPGPGTDDFLQELYLKLNHLAEKYRSEINPEISIHEDEKLKNWVILVSRRFFRAYRLKQTARLKKPAGMERPKEVSHLDLYDKEKDSIQVEYERLFKRLLEEKSTGLTDKEREVIELLYFSGLNNQEVALELCTTPHCVRTYSCSARKKLFEVLPYEVLDCNGWFRRNAA